MAERRRRTDRKRENLERWVISYADFTTLLLATFVVLYAISSVNTTKFQEMADALSTSFVGTTTVQSGGMGAQNKAPFDHMPSPVQLPVTAQVDMKNVPPAVRREFERQMAKLTDAYQRLQRLLADMIEKGQIRVALSAQGVVIDINAKLLFESGKADLTPESLAIIDQIAGILKPLQYRIQVNGFTDSAPVHTAQFASNWDLSAIRAMSVVKRFVDIGVDPTTLVGAGFGEYHPVAANDTPDNMAMNRRVSIVVIAPGRPGDANRLPILDASGADDQSGGPLPASDAGAAVSAPAAPRSPGVAPRAHP